MELILPYPISTNRYWRTFRNQTVLSREAKQYKQEVAWLAKQAKMSLLEGEVEIHVRLIPRARKDGSASLQVLDLDNALKVLLDALQGVAYLNDRQVKKIVADYAPHPKADGGVRATILPLASN